MSITTVKIETSTKAALDDFKGTHESYDDVISRLVVHVKCKDLKKQLIEAYTKNSKDDLKLVKEWEIASQEVSDEWD